MPITKTRNNESTKQSQSIPPVWQLVLNQGFAARGTGKTLLPVFSCFLAFVFS